MLACGHFCWYSLLAITPALLQTTSRLSPSSPSSDGSKGCFKETLLSKIFYEDRFLCISNQSSKSRDQLRHPFVVLHPSPCPGSKKTKQKNILQLERGWGRQEGEELEKPTHASKRSSRIKSFLQSESTSMLSTREAGVAPRTQMHRTPAGTLLGACQGSRLLLPLFWALRSTGASSWEEFLSPHS